MQRDAGVLIVTAGAMILAAVCCVGLPLLAGAMAAIGVGTLFGGLGVAAVIAIIACVVLTLRWRQRGCEVAATANDQSAG